MLNEHDIAAMLRKTRQDNRGRPWLLVEFTDTRIDWSSLGVCTNHGLPSIDHGQATDCRWSVEGNESLHAHWHPKKGIVYFHLDRCDPTQDPIGHLITDTYIPHAAGLGGVIGGLSLGAWGAVGGSALGAIAATLIAPKPTSTWKIHYYNSEHDWQLRQVVQTRQPAYA